MKKYDVYGIGNALVDMEFAVTDEFLNEHGLEKGVMTLIDEAQQDKLVSSATESFGLTKRAGGGSAANTMVGLSQFGGNAFYACKVAHDETGQFFHKDLDASGVNSRLDEFEYQGTTGKCLVMVTPDAERTMHTFLGITTDFSVEELHLEDLIQSEYLYVEGYLVSSEKSLEAIRKTKEVARENGIKIALTFSDPAMVKYFKSGLEMALEGGIDLLFCNEEEACLWANTDDVEAAKQELLKHTELLVVTRGSKGASIVSNDGVVRIAPHNVEAVDTNGAGDMFAGAFLYGITQGHSHQLAGDLASLASAKVVTSFGPRLAKSEQSDILKQIIK